ncbi:MAG TPA: hypothetical protein VIP57_00620 [Candidatus Dormibacteraeota bacterium]|jgi:hypothetical protein
MNDFYLQLAKDRQSELIHEAHNQSLAKGRLRNEPLVRVSFTFELRLGGRQRQVASES